MLIEQHTGYPLHIGKSSSLIINVRELGLVEDSYSWFDNDDVEYFRSLRPVVCLNFDITVDAKD